MDNKVTKEDYLRKKGLLPPEPLGEMYTFESTRKGVGKIKKILIWKHQVSSGRGSNGEFKINNYDFQESPFSGQIYDDNLVGVNRGCGSGFGDLWSWTWFISLDETALIQARQEEFLRIKEKYLDAIDEEAELKAMADSYDWIKVKKYEDDDSLIWLERYKKLEEHHKAETEFLINKCRELALKVLDEKRKTIFG
jgi:hypothetical protein